MKNSICLSKRKVSPIKQPSEEVTSSSCVALLNESREDPTKYETEHRLSVTRTEADGHESHDYSPIETYKIHGTEIYHLDDFGYEVKPITPPKIEHLYPDENILLPTLSPVTSMLKACILPRATKQRKISIEQDVTPNNILTTPRCYRQLNDTPPLFSKDNILSDPVDNIITGKSILYSSNDSVSKQIYHIFARTNEIQIPELDENECNESLTHLCLPEL